MAGEGISLARHMFSAGLLALRAASIGAYVIIRLEMSSDAGAIAGARSPRRNL
jgi:hypothetical protein